MKTIKVLVACEFSGVVREAFNSYHGVHAVSCDVLPPEDGRVDYHYQGNVLDIINDGWNVMVFFAPCTYLCNSGVRWLDKGKNIERMNLMQDGAEFFNRLLNADIPYIAGENPIQHKYARKIIRKYDQIIQPWQFGHGEQKSTCLWLKGLPKLIPTNIVDGRTQRVWKESPSDTRWMERSRTYSGIAQAMANQWIKEVLKVLS